MKFPAKIIGPSVRAGFNDPPVMGPAMNTLQARVKPTARGATPAGALSSVTTEIITYTRIKVTRISTTNAHRSPTFSAGKVAARLISSRAALP